MWDKSFLHHCIENSDRNRLVPKSFGFLSFWGNSGPISGRKLTFFYHCMLEMPTLDLDIIFTGKAFGKGSF